MIRSSTQSALHASISLSSTYTAQTTNAPSDIVCEGPLLKKRRKKMQGFARRHFVLQENGILSYSFARGQPTRDSMSLHFAAVTTSPGRKDIHVDSNTATFHIKCLNTQDFDMWMSAIRKFINAGTEVKRSASIRIASRQGAHNKTSNIVEEMATTIEGLDGAFTTLFEQMEASAAMSRESGSGSRRSDKDKYKDKFTLFKKPHQMDTPNVSAEPLQAPNAVLCQQIRDSIAQLRNQHSSLSRLYQQPSSPIIQHRMPAVRGADEEDRRPQRSPSIRSPMFAQRHPNRLSRASIASDDAYEWFDAEEDGPEEFLIDLGDNGEPRPSQLTLDSTSTSEQQDDGSSVDTDIEEPVPSANPLQVAYRCQLPVPAPEDEGSLFAILKRNVGKDLSTITFPVTFNEPLTLLQRSAEELEYFELLNEASQVDDDVTRLAYVAAFAVSSYAHTRHRSGRKGFNPMLAETFEDARLKFVSEKVRHNPVEIAYHAEGRGWELTGMSAGRTKFWGKSLEIIPSGSTRVRIGSDEYMWLRPSTFIRNLVVGAKYLEHTGQMTVENTTTGMRCVLDFKQNGYWGPSNVVSGAVTSSSGETLTRLEGKWDDQMALTPDGNNFRVLWRCSPFPIDCMQHYGFTTFGVTLNEITKEMAGKLPPTDSRFRPDVRALENGDIETAEAEKTRIEAQQRERRNRGNDARPRWFKQAGDEWDYVGGYWEARARNWKGESIPQLW